MAVDESIFFKSQEQQCRSAASSARDPEQRRGLLQLANYYAGQARASAKGNGHGQH